MPASDNKEFKTKKDVVVELIREAILSAEFKPGDRLLQEEIAKRLNVSPTPVREALRQLEAEGVLDHSPHRGVRVTEIKFEDVREIYLIRAALEALATREAASNLSRTNIAYLRALQTEIEMLIAEDSLKDLRRLNYDLHMAIYNAANMPELYRLIRNLWTKFPWDTLHVLPGRADRSAHEHQDIIEAIAAGDANLAGQRMQAHIEHGARSLMEFLASHPPGEAAAELEDES
jgi:DNA-binding GntR family transcriptional regulator